ncbi:glycosyltransferase family 2 protein [Eubacterium sp. 1001713B170207_170306_E7]|uniref:glycosyltransferase family 2 protein n=1 Tax=Eubacterium sp. 1001713B170207_170306_E7 TaxID=2787097 RepID=UPI0018975583|nr:glycosyltransferase family 2 protein [Eubacterium sp. 1001713B170207_170306_E7]
MGLITIVVPCYNEEAVLPAFYSAVCQALASFPASETFELLFVDDGSADRTLSLIRGFAEQDSRVRYLSFSRNFGKEAAIYAGLQHARGSLVALMDADLQDPPDYLLRMYRAIAAEGYDCAAARRVSRKGEPKIRSFLARRFYGIMHKIGSADIVDGARDYRMMTRPVVDAILSVTEYNRFSKGIFSWVGFKTKWLEYENIERAAGETKWSVWKLFKYSVEGITAFSVAPLALASFGGMALCGVAVIAILFIIIRQLLYGGSAFGWPSLACIVIFIGGIQLLCVGILGQYLAKTYLEVKERPVYIVREASGEKDVKQG